MDKSAFYAIITMIITSGVTLTTLGVAFMVRRRTPAALPGADLRPQLERIEHAVEAMAIEVERISEAQRFTTKLLADQAGARSALPPGA